MEWENLTKVLPEVDFPFHEDTTKVKEMIAQFFQNYTSYSQPSQISLTNDKYNYGQY